MPIWLSLTRGRSVTARIFPAWRPDAAPEGIRFVIVNGQIAARDGRMTGAMAGRPIFAFEALRTRKGA